MLRKAYEYRAAGDADLAGRWGESVMFTLVYFIIASIFSTTVGGVFNLMATGVGSILSLLILPMEWGYSVTFLTNHRREDNDPFDISHLFDGYRDFLRIFTTLLLRSIYVFLWTLLLVVPGIIKALSYAMTPFILRDRPDLKNNRAIELSMAMMDGHKVDLFWLYLTFLGWAILCIFTLGIGLLWLYPYMSSTIANFYEDVKAEYENGGSAAYQETPQTEAPRSNEATQESGADNYQKKY